MKGISEKGVSEIGYGIADDYHGKGYATEAVGALADWVFRQPGVMCIMGETEETNVASQCVLKKTGFISVGDWPPTETDFSSLTAYRGGSLLRLR